MKTLKERMADISLHLQKLLDPKIYPKVQKAVIESDKDSLIEVCRKAEVPRMYISTIVTILFSVKPNQKWPIPEF